MRDEGAGGIGTDSHEVLVVPGRGSVVSKGVKATGVDDIEGDEVVFERFYLTSEPRLRRALMAAYGPEAGREATANALGWAWEHRDRLATIERPLSYLYRVGQSSVRQRKAGFAPARVEWSEPWVEPDLVAGLLRLSERQRVVVVLIHGYGWSAAEVAELLGVKATTVKSHLERGLRILRSHLKVQDDD